MKSDSERLIAFAKQYTGLVSALVREGVPEPTAREEARIVAATNLFVNGDEGPKCPMCGRGAKP